ncbi:MAG: hypothetical protein FD163_1956 [Hyphomonadaceae bacterium]|nr:MAG: hypothetical protein FD128_2823 [Hyphomonadaceae bacterium]KAF0184382.1 MAG: hypothetical protein FD163_1956 [Hyphomonadaceae bacterium]
MITTMSQAERTEIANAIKAQEVKTSGEIYCVVARRSDDYSDIIMIYAVFLALLLPLGIGFYNFIELDFARSFNRIYLPWNDTPKQADFVINIWQILTLQTLVFICAAIIAKYLKISIMLVPKFVKRQNVHKASLEQFTAHGIHQTDARTGVLIYLSQAEKMVEVVADKGIYSKVDKAVWEDAVVKILAKSKDGDLVHGLIDGIETVGAVLAEHFAPSENDVNEISDSVVFI